MNNHPLTAFVERMMIEYHTIFPTVESVIQHLLFVYGNGYKFDDSTGLIYSTGDNIEKCFIHEQTAFTCDSEKQQFIDRQYQSDLIREKDDRSRSRNLGAASNGKSRMVKATLVTITDDMFSYESILGDISKSKPVKYNRDDVGIIRLYQPSNYSLIYKLTVLSPIWLLDLALIFSTAWRTYLSDITQSESILLPELDLIIIRLTALKALTDDV